MNELTKMIVSMAPEFGISLKESAEDIEGEVADKLKRAAKIDEVDTITFGLETDDGKIVKVFVNAEDADKFEKLMADMLGEEDNIEDALNRVADEVDIIDVEWPEEDEEDGDADDVDADLDDDGSDVLDKKVYDKANLNKEVDAGTKPAIEGFTYGERFAFKLSEADNSRSLATRLTTPAQQLVYQAIIELGVPEVALARTAYRAEIVRGIKATALEIQKRSVLKTALKMFVKRAIDFDKLEDDDSDKTAVTTRVARALGIKVRESMLTESPISDLYWELVEGLLKAVDESPTKEYAAAVMKLSSYKSLVARSAAVLQDKLSGDARAKMQQLQKVMGVSAPAVKAGVVETLTNTQVPAFIVQLIELADGDASKNLSKQVLTNTATKSLLQRAPNMAGQIPAQVKTRIEALMKALSSGMTEDAKPAEKPIDLTGGPPQVNQLKWTISATSTGVTFKAEDDSAAYEVVDEDLERMMKALANNESITVKDVSGAKLVISPRGRAAVIKVVGTQVRIQLNAADVESVLDAAGTSISGDETAH